MIKTLTKPQGFNFCGEQMELEKISKVSKLLEHSEISTFIPNLSQPLVIKTIQDEINNIREAIKNEACLFSEDRLIENICRALNRKSLKKAQKVINATGILVHTNLGRTPFSKEIWFEIADTLCGYSNLEIDLTTGKRGSRMGLLNELIALYFGVESSVIVNNNAAAVYLILKTFAENKEVIVSRGEQVQIGGGFRIPEILEESGAILKDVGTTNITTIDDYLSAITENTSMVLVVHPSNYYIEGFTAQVDLKALKEALPPHVLLVVDQGSGNMDKKYRYEKTVSEYLNMGADIVSFSGDKLLGGPQSGFIIGRESLISPIAKHNMMRVFRPGKETYAYLENLLIKRLNKKDRNIADAFSYSAEAMKQKAAEIAAINPLALEVVPSTFFVGGGTTPKAKFETFAVKINSFEKPDHVLKYLRHCETPIIAVIQDNSVLIYPVALTSDDQKEVMRSLNILFENHKI